VTIGGDPANEIIIEEPTVSRRHAEVTKRSDVFQIRDLGSTNGTFVNGKRVEAPTPIEAGDEIRFGAVRLYVRRDAGAQTTRRRFPHAPAAFALLLAPSALSYQFVKNWLALLDGADGITSGAQSPRS
jgi:predicted component of type VI protein secretion system